MERLHLFLNGQRGIEVLKAIVNAGHGVTRVHVPPSKVSSIKRQIEPYSNFTEICEAHDENSASFVSSLASTNPNLLLVAGYPTIFTRNILTVAKFGVVNLHAGRLPEYRGGSPLNWQIINGETSAGVSVISMNEGIDSGDVLAEAEVPIGADDTISMLHDGVNAVFPKLVLKVIGDMEVGQLEPRKQIPEEAKYWHQRNDRDGRIDWKTMTARTVHNLVRGITTPYPGAWSEQEGRKVRILGTSIPDEVICGVPGRILFLQGKGPYVVCKDQAILLTSFQFEEDNGRLQHGRCMQ
jgi:methionyl-tRNA formyltransferase